MKNKFKFLFSIMMVLGILCLGFSFGGYLGFGANEAYAINGGAVYLKTGAKYTMGGGSIKNKTAERGGAVFIDEDATFTMNGGTISGNTATKGSGVYIASGGTFNMNGGTMADDVYAVGSMVYGGGTVSGNITLDGAEKLTINKKPTTALKITALTTAVGTKLAKVNASDFAISDISVSGLPTGRRAILSGGYVVVDYTYHTITIEVSPSGYGSVSKTSVSVAYGTSISATTTAEKGVLTIGSNTIDATPTTDTAQYDYSFTSWTGASGTVTGDKTITANFSRAVKTYTVTWLNDDGTTIAEEVYNYGSTPSRTGPSKETTAYYSYEFAGWSPSITTVTGDKTYTATYTATPVSYTVTLSKGVGISSVSGEGTYAYGTSVTITATMESHYHWSKWTGYTTTTSRQYTFTMPAQNVTLQAHAELDTFTLTVKYYTWSVTNSTSIGVYQNDCYVDSGGDVAYNKTTTVTHGYSTNGFDVVIETLNFDYDYYMDIEEITELSNVNRMSYRWVPTKNETINIYIAQRYKVSYSASGSTSGTAPESHYKIHGVAEEVAQNSGYLAKTGHTFIGWSETENRVDGMINYQEGDYIGKNEDITLYPTWEINTYKLNISYSSAKVTNATNLKVTQSDCNVSGGTDLESGEIATVSHTYTTTSYTITIERLNTSYTYYIGTSAVSTSSKTNSITYSWTPTANGTIYIYVGQRYQVSYSTSGSTSGTAPSTQNKVHGTDLTLSINAGSLAKTGYTYVGWSTSSNDTDGTASYSAGGTYSSNSSTTLYPAWKINTYTVTYNATTNGGTFGNASGYSSTASVNYGSSIDLSKTNRYGSKSGWTFVGWNTSSTATSALSSLTMGAGDVTLYAIYSKTLTGTFYYGLSKASNKTVSTTIYNTATSGSITTPANQASVTYNSRTFTALGWRDDTTAGNKEYSESTSVTISANTSFYQVYSGTLTLSYNANGGSSTPSSQTATQYYNSNGSASSHSFTLASAISKTGHTFSKWASGSTSGTKYSAGGSVSISSNTTFYATWTINTYTITWLNDDGTTIAEEVYNYGSTPSRTGPSKETTAYYSYEFAGWSPSITTVTGDKTYTATYTATPVSYTVTVNKGTGISSVSGGGSHGYGTSVTINATVSTGYTWKNWTGYKSTTTKQYTFTMPAQNVTFTANATINTYTITWLNEDGTTITEEVYNYGSTPSRTGPSKSSTAQYTYTFAGWSPSITTVTGDKTYTATYTATPVSYTVTVNKGTGISSVSGGGSHGYGTSVTINATVSTGYTWKNWTGYKSTTTKQYTFTMPAQNVTFTANATINTYTITWLNEDGTTIAEEVYNYGSTPSRSGPSKSSTAQYSYTFAGWSPSITTVTGDKTYTATYTSTLRSYTVTLASGYGNWDNSTAITANYGTSISISSNKVTVGSTTRTWTTSSTTAQYSYSFTSLSKSTSGSTITGNVTVTPNVTRTTRSYTVTLASGYGSWDNSTAITANYGTSISISSNKVTVGSTTRTWTTSSTTAQYSYSFTSLSKSTSGSTITGNVTVTPNVTRTTRDYTVTVAVNNSNYGSVDTTSITVPYGTAISASGTTLSVGGYGSVATPKTDTAQYDYYFSSWTGASGTVTGNKTITANFGRSTRSYTITVAVNNSSYGSVDTTSITAEYGTTISASGSTLSVGGYGAVATPKTDTAQYDYYFSSWTGASGTVTGNKTITANFGRSTRSYTITVAVNNSSYGSVDTTSITAEYGTTISASGSTLSVGGYGAVATPKTDTAQYDYYFSSWTGASGTVTGNKTITANFGRSTQTYTVTWKNHDGTVLETDTGVSYGTTPTYNGSTPSKSSTAQYTYTFSGWSPSVGAITGATTYTAQFSASKVGYYITYDQNGGYRVSDGLTNDVTYIYDWGYTDTISERRREGYTLVGYTLTDAYGGNNIGGATITFDFSTKTGKVTMGTASIVVTMKWQVNTYTITIAVNNSSYGSVDTTSITAEYGTTISASGSTLSVGGYGAVATPKTDTAQYDYYFSSWTGASGTVTGDKTITAVFGRSVNNYTVSITSDSISWFSITNTVTGISPSGSSFMVAYGTTYRISGNVLYVGDYEVAGYANSSTSVEDFYFGGWNGSSSGTITGNKTFSCYSNSFPKEYTLSFGGSGCCYEDSSSNVFYSRSVTITGGGYVTIYNINEYTFCIDVYSNNYGFIDSYVCISETIDRFTGVTICGTTYTITAYGNNLIVDITSSGSFTPRQN